MANDTRLGDALSMWEENGDPPCVTEDIQVWRVELSACRELLDTLLVLLREEERQRAHRTRAGEAREQFVVGRAVLRLLLGKELAVAPAAVTLSANQHGKLELDSQESLQFNVAHSGEMILLALTRSGPVGIDVEALDRTVDAMEVAHTAFSASEIEQLQQCRSSADQLPAFFRGWTRKEAVVKADGCGLGVPLTQFEVPMSDASGGVVKLPPHEGCAGGIFRVGEIAPGEGYIGALAGIWRNQRTIGYGLSRTALPRLISRAMR